MIKKRVGNKLDNFLNRLLSLKNTLSIALIYSFSGSGNLAFLSLQTSNISQINSLKPNFFIERQFNKNVAMELPNNPTSLSNQPTAIKEVVIVDATIQEPDRLIANLSVQTKVYYLNPNQDGIEQISQVLNSHHNLQAIHILAHGRAGQLNLGSGVLNSLTFQSQAEKLQIWGQALAVDGDILLYGCNFAQGQIGQAAVHSLAQLTGADIAASHDYTGSSSFRGDWSLEVQIGKIEFSSTLNYFAHSNYNYVLVDNPDLLLSICNSQVDLLFVLDESGSVDENEILQQRQALLDTLQYLVNNNVNARVAIVAFARESRSLTSTYIQVNATTIASGGALDVAIQNYATSVTRSYRRRTNWESSLDRALGIVNTTGIYPDALIFLTDGRINAGVSNDGENDGRSPDNEADTFKSNGTHIYTVSVGSFVSGSDLFRLTDGASSEEYNFNNPNPLVADHVTVDEYSDLSSSLLTFFREACAESASLTKEFVAETIVPTAVSTLTFTVNNIDNNPIKSEINFTDEFPENVTIVYDENNPNDYVTNTCNGTLTNSTGGNIADGDTGITLTDGSLALGTTSCEISVKVTSYRNLATTYTNDSSNISNGNNINTENLNATLIVELLPVSPLAGNLVINEVLYRGTNGSASVNNEFIELYNASDTNIDLTGLQIIDGNLLATGNPNADDSSSGSINGGNKSYTFGDVTVTSSGSLILEPDDYAVIWIGSDSNPLHNATQATFQAWLNKNPRLNNTGDDLWLYDAETKIIDYIAYGRNTNSSTGINARPDSETGMWEQWDNTYETSLDEIDIGQSISLTPNGIDGNTSACWEKTAITDTDANSASSRCTGYLTTADQDSSALINSVGANNNGDPSLILVKRITNLTPNPNSIDFTTVVNDGISNSHDDDPNWENNFLQGHINIKNVQPGDEIEYTIYFLSNGTGEVNNVKICDLVPDNMSFVEHPFIPEDEFIVQPEAGFKVFKGIELFIGKDSSDSDVETTIFLSNALDDDQGEFYAPNTTPPSYCKKLDPNTGKPVSVDVSDNTSGVVVVELDDPLPSATEAGTPSNSYGFVRFRVKID